MIAPWSFMIEMKLNTPCVAYSKSGTHRIYFSTDVDALVNRVGVLMAVPRMHTHPEEYPDVIGYPCPPVDSIAVKKTKPKRK